MTPAGPPLNVQAPNRVFSDLYPRLKLTFAPTDRDKIMIEGLGDPTIIDFANNTGSLANSTDQLASIAQLQGGWKAIGQWDHFFTPDIDAKVFGGYSYSYIENGPQGYVRSGVTGFDFTRAGHTNLDDGTSWFNSQAWQRSGRYRLQFDGSLTTRGHASGSHEAEIGYQSSILQYHQDTRIGGNGSFYRDRGGGPLTNGLCDADPALTPAGGVTGNGCNSLITTTDTVQRQKAWTLGFYVQDRYKPTSWLTLLPGLRYDVSRASLVDYDDSLTLAGWGPRMSVITDLTRDEKTIFQLSYGHATEMTYLSPFNQVDGARKGLTTTSTWDQATKSFINPVTVGGPGGIFIASGTRVPPHSDEIVASLRRELFINSVGTIEYTYKRISNVVEFVETNAIFDPSGNRIIGGRDGTRNSIITLDFPDENKSYYSGLDFILESHPFPNLDFFGAYTLSWTYGPGYQNANDGRGVTNPSNRFDQFANPRQAKFVYGYAPGIDTRHNIKTQLTYTFHGATVGTIITYRSGVAQQKIFTGVSGSVPPRFRTPNGIDPVVPNDVTSWAEVRTPDLFVVNLTGTYDFYELTRQHLIAQATVFNLFDASTPTLLQQTETAPPSRFGQAITRVAPLSLQLGLRYQY